MRSNAIDASYERYSPRCSDLARGPRRQGLAEFDAGEQRIAIRFDGELRVPSSAQGDHHDQHA